MWQSLFFNKVAGLRPTINKVVIKKQTLAQVLSREFCEIPKNTFFYRTPLVAALETAKQCLHKNSINIRILVGALNTFRPNGLSNLRKTGS